MGMRRTLGSLVFTLSVLTLGAPVAAQNARPTDTPTQGNNAPGEPQPASPATRKYLKDLALQLPFLKTSESMGNHDSEIVDAGSVD
jgi:hypothetical protein